MGSVYEAVHTDLERRVAVKILNADLCRQDELVTMFREEAKAASRIGSQYIVDIFDFGALPDGRLFYVMDLLEGRTLAQEIIEGAMPLDRVIGLLRQACKGLAAAHDAGIVHRDVKPANLFVSAAKPATIKVLDFGISAFQGAPAAEVHGLGTPHYMAPEQITEQAFDRTLDVYSLGCTAYRLLVGRPPFVGETIDQVLDQHLWAEPPKASELAAGEHEIPPAIDRVLLRCIAKDPLERYPDMHELEAALCEAQIEIGLTTAWDELTLPDVGVRRRAQLQAAMPNPIAAKNRRRRNRAAALVLGVTTSAAFIAIALFRPRETTVDPRIDTLVDEAQHAAARAFFVYPPPYDPASPTAYVKVLELEALEVEDGSDVAAQRAAELRGEFSQTLTYLGDRYWNEQHGRVFAIDYYAQAVVFDESNSHAVERAAMSIGQLVALRQKAAKQDFTELELATVQPLIALVETDRDKRDAQLVELIGEDSELPARTTTQVVQLLGDSEVSRRALAPAEDSALEAVPDEDMAAVTPTDEPVADPGGARGGTKTPGDELPRTAREPARARARAQQASRAFKSGDWEAAEQLYRQALADDHRCGPALIGLSDLFFERNELREAIRFAERAVAAYPRQSSYQLRLGDAYFAALRYADAKRAYERAKQLGNDKAVARLAKVEGKLGGAR
jgi:tetratricopeptide (TPR) repeat protein